MQKVPGLLRGEGFKGTCPANSRKMYLYKAVFLLFHDDNKWRFGSTCCFLFQLLGFLRFHINFSGEGQDTSLNQSRGELSNGRQDKEVKELRDNPGIFETTRVGRVKGFGREEVGEMEAQL